METMTRVPLRDVPEKQIVVGMRLWRADEVEGHVTFFDPGKGTIEDHGFLIVSWQDGEDGDWAWLGLKEQLRKRKIRWIAEIA